MLTLELIGYDADVVENAGNAQGDTDAHMSWCGPDGPESRTATGVCVYFATALPSTTPPSSGQSELFLMSFQPEPWPQLSSF